MKFSGWSNVPASSLLPHPNYVFHPEDRTKGTLQKCRTGCWKTGTAGLDFFQFVQNHYRFITINFMLIVSRLRIRLRLTWILPLKVTCKNLYLISNLKLVIQLRFLTHILICNFRSRLLRFKSSFCHTLIQCVRLLVKNCIRIVDRVRIHSETCKIPNCRILIFSSYKTSSVSRCNHRGTCIKCPGNCDQVRKSRFYGPNQQPTIQTHVQVVLLKIVS